MEDTDSQELPAKNWAISKDLYQKDPVPLQNPGEWRPITMDKVHRGIVGGAYVSAPSENLGFVFGGSMVWLFSFFPWFILLLVTQPGSICH